MAKDRADVADLEASQVELATGERQKQATVIRVEEVQPSIAALLVADWLRQAFEVPAPIAVVVQAREEFEVAAIAGTENPGEDAQAVKGFS
jgi:hypothetical protein